MADLLLSVAVRTAVHSVVAAVLVELVLWAWAITCPVTRYRLRVVALLTPPLTGLLAPLGQAAGWPTLLTLSPWSAVGVGPLTLGHLWGLLGVTMVVLLMVQEGLPWWRQRRRLVRGLPAPPPAGSRLHTALEEVFAAAPAVPVSCLELPVKSRTLFIQRVGGRTELVHGGGFPDWLDDLELRAVLAHERAHVERRDLRTRGWLYLVRLLQAHTPGAVLMHRQLINDSEEACDDEAVRRVGAPLALASALLKTHASVPGVAGGGPVMAAARSLEHGASSMRVARRVERLLTPRPLVAASGPELALFTAGLAALLLGVC